MQPVGSFELHANEFNHTRKKPHAAGEHRNAQGDVAYSLEVLNGCHDCGLESLFMSALTP